MEFIKGIDQVGTIEVSAHDIDAAIKEIGALKASFPTELTINLGIAVEGNMLFNKITFPDLKITFPDILEFEPNDDYEIVNNALVLSQIESDNTGYIPPIPLKIKGYKFGNETLMEKNHRKYSQHKRRSKSRRKGHC